MTLLKTFDDGWIVDELLFYNRIYEKNYKRNLYKIEEPFILQSQLDALKRKYNKNNGDDKNDKKRKGKRPKLLSHHNDDYWTDICKFAEQTFDNFATVGKALNLFEETKPLILCDNNKIAKNTLTDIHNEECPIPVTSMSTFQRTFYFKNEQFFEKLHSSCVYFNDSNMVVSIRIENIKNSFIIPPNSRFICGNIQSGLETLIKDQIRYDLIVMDPPWENKSIKRKRNYEMLPEHDLCKLPINDLMAFNGLLAIWVTNNKRLLTFVKETLFEKFKIQLVAEWIWLKSTTSGEPVCKFRADFKMPFEIVLIGVQKNSFSDSSNNKLPPYRKYFLSVPCILPSRKVPLLDILKDFLPRNHSTLELFARNLLPNTTSVGDEVLKMQSASCFEM